MFSFIKFAVIFYLVHFIRTDDSVIEAEGPIDQSATSWGSYTSNRGRHLIKGEVIERAIDVNLSDVRLYLCTRRNQRDGVAINPANFTGIINSDYFDPRRIDFFVAHGMNANRRSMHGIKDAILARIDANVFLIDYEGPASVFYTIAVTAVPKVGAIIGEMIKKVRSHYDISFDDINLVGHSLGAHLVGSIGAHLQGKTSGGVGGGVGEGGKVNYIVGLDPAGPVFQNFGPERRLDRSDAQFVQVLHCNGGFQGMRRSVGHADYFPNGGGMNQAGCGTDLTGSCAHQRAIHYYEESIETGGFIGTVCENYETYSEGLCKGNSESPFGQIFIDKGASGNYYFDTNSERPFAKTSAIESRLEVHSVNKKQ